MGATPLIAATGAEVVAWHRGEPIDAERFLAHAHELATALPDGRHLLNLCADRYRFAVTLCAAMLSGRICLLPPNHTPDLLRRLAGMYRDTGVVSDTDGLETTLPVLSFPPAPSPGTRSRTRGEVPVIDDRQVVAHVFTSGSTGLPTAHRKTWGSLVRNVRAEARRLGVRPGATLVGTVPPQHMYGFESTVLLALQNRIAFHGGSPFFPADIVAALAATPGDRVLVTTPYHLRMLLAEPLQLPPVAMVVSATAPLAPALAREAELRFGAPLVEIYGCTEAGQLATRRPTQGDTWATFDGVRVSRRESPVPGATGWYAEGGHIETPTRLSDVLELHGPERFRLLGRDADMVNVAGKRASIAHLNHLLCAIPGVIDGAFFNPDGGAREVQRLTAFVVTESLTPRAILAGLRRATDAVFLPRPLHLVDRLPRAATGKLPQAALEELARRCAEQPERRGRRARATGAADGGATR